MLGSLKPNMFRPEYQFCLPGKSREKILAEKSSSIQTVYKKRSINNPYTLQQTLLLIDLQTRDKSQLLQQCCKT